MLHHVSFGVADLQRSAAFYDAVLATLGFVRVWTDRTAVGYGREGGGDLFAVKLVDAASAPGPGFHLAFSAPSREAVAAFHGAALRGGGRDNGAPGLRPRYGPHYYAAFVLDPDGHRIEAVTNTPAMEAIESDRLSLEPLTERHAQEMFALLDDPELYRYLDFPPPPSIEHLRGVYRKLESRQSPDGEEAWLNWVVRPAGGALAGFVQATVRRDATAFIAYTLGRSSWGRGYATEAMAAVLAHLERSRGVRRALAAVEAANVRSIRLLERLGFRAATPQEAAAQGIAESERLYVRDAG